MDIPKKDIDFFYLSRQLPQAYKEEKIIKSWDDVKNKFQDLLYSALGYKNPDYSFNEYIAWLKEKTDKNISFKEIVDEKFTAPISDGNYIEKLSNLNLMIRDKHILNVILNHTKKYKKVLVIYGGSHYVTQKDVLEKYLGKPQYFNP